MSNPFDEINSRLERLEKILLEIKNSQTLPLTIDRWFTRNELSEYLPGRPTAATIYSWIFHKKIPYHKLGKKLSFLQSEIDAWLISKKQITKDEIEKIGKNFIENKIKHNRK